MAANYELHNQLDRYRALLAEAEAREAGEKLTLREARQIALRASEVVEAGIKADRDAYASAPDAAASDEISKVDIQTLLNELTMAKNETDQVTALYDEAHEKMTMAESEIARLNGVLQTQEPDAAAVIAQCREALDGIDSITRCMHLDMGGKHKYHIQLPKQHDAIVGVKAALAAIAAWEVGR